MVRYVGKQFRDLRKFLSPKRTPQKKTLPKKLLKSTLLRKGKPSRKTLVLATRALRSKFGDLGIRASLVHKRAKAKTPRQMPLMLRKRTARLLAPQRL